MFVANNSHSHPRNKLLNTPVQYRDIAALCVSGVGGVSPPPLPHLLVLTRTHSTHPRSLENDEYDDGSYGPVFVRLAWHAAGTYDKKSGTGGSNGATMRHAAEAGHGANAGLDVARKVLERVKAKHPGLSYADLWSLAGVVREG